MAEEIDRILQWAHTPLEVLSLTEPADEKTYRAEFRRLSLLVHPDKVTDDGLKQRATAAFRKLFDSVMTLKTSPAMPAHHPAEQSASSSVPSGDAPRAHATGFTKWWQHATVEQMERAFMREEELFLLEIEAEKQRYIARKRKKWSSAPLIPRVVIPANEAIGLAECDQARVNLQTAKWQSFHTPKTPKRAHAAVLAPKRRRAASPAPTFIAPPASEPVVTEPLCVPQMTLVSRFTEFGETIDAASVSACRDPPETVGQPRLGIKFTLAAPRNGIRPKLIHQPQSKLVHEPSRKTASDGDSKPNPAGVGRRVSAMFGKGTSTSDTAVALVEIGQPSVHGWTSSWDADG
eukprot:GEMP01050286.1.p1 GENE.GEMP01050286.1~~GEMP01050286.1.p1  ORF type:complete len:348 (+),score=72.38 GEMP01050286.1:82-1125(+)